MSKFSMSWVAKGLLILLVASFAIWGVTDWFGARGQKDTVATIGHETISKEKLYRAIHGRMSQLPAQAKIDVQQQPGLIRIIALQSLRSLIRDLALKQELTKLGISVSEKTLKEIITERPEFKDEDGKFSKEKFDSMLAHNRLTERAFLAYEKDHLRLLFLWRAIFLKGALVPDAMMLPLQQQLREERSVGLVEIPAHIFPVTNTYTEAELKSYYDAHIEQFQLEETRDLSIIVLSESPQKKGQDKEEIKDALYEKARLVQDRIAEGDSLEHIAQTMGLTYGAIKGVTRQGFTLQGLPIKDTSGLFSKKVVEHAFEFGEGNESDITPLKDKMHYIVLVDKISPGEILPFDKAKEKAKEYLQNEVRMKKAAAFASEIVKKVNKGALLKNLAQKEHLSYRDLTRVSLLGEKPVLPEVTLISAFSLPVKGASLVPTPKGMTVIQVLDIRRNAILASNQAYKKAIERFQSDFRRDVEDAFVDALEEELTVKINEKNFQEVVDAF